MRVLMQNRWDAFNKPGGDTALMVRTKEALERLGVEVEISLTAETDYRSFDVVHLYNLITFHDTEPQMRAAKAAGKRVALQPIWWSMTEYEIHRARRPSWNVVRRLLGSSVTARLFQAWQRSRRPHHRTQSWLLRTADALLVAANAERDMIRSNFEVPPETVFQVTPNGLDSRLFLEADRQWFIETHALQDFVLCASRIEDRKNQLALIRAMDGIDVPLVLIGQSNPNQLDYADACRAAAKTLGPNKVIFMDHMDQRQLASAYAAAKVHALPSWYEIASLASMEAAVAGCNIVTTDRSAVDEYFGDLAWRCDPSNVRSIHEAIQAALAAPRTTALRDKLVSGFSWERTAKATLEGYEKALGTRNP